jgi:regulation of enolase protein 1 (concanavalin A-like superfamily)
LNPVFKQNPDGFRSFAFVLVALATFAVSVQRVQAAGVGDWTAADVGAPAIKGTATQLACSSSSSSCPVFAIGGGGLGVTGTSDQFMFLYQKLTGDGVITVRLLSLAGTSTAEAGLMLRESLTATAPHASILNSGAGVSFRTRLTAGKTTTSTAVSKGTWMRLERVGPTVTALVSSDGSQWTIVGTKTVALPSTIYAGMVVTSRLATALGTASVTGMSLTAVTPTLPVGWTSADVGTAASAGMATYSDGSFIALSGGGGFTASKDAFRFIYTRVLGDAKLSTRVAASAGPAGRQAGIVLRSTLSAASMEIALVADEQGVLLVSRSSATQAPVKTRVTSAVAPVMLQMDRRGSMVTSSYSTDGATWKVAATTSIPFAAEIYAGLGTASGPKGGLAAAAFDRLSLISVAANAPPVVALTKPLAAAIVVKGTSVAMAATASDPDDLVARVDFLVNGTKVASDTSSPYTATWTAGAPGVYSVTAAAVDSDAAVTTSLPALVTVVPSGDSSNNPPPVPIGPWRLVFDASSDHATLDHYVLEIYSTLTQKLVTTRNLGKPAKASNGTCTVDVDAFVAALPLGLYDAVVKAVASNGSTPSFPYTFNK